MNELSTVLPALLPPGAGAVPPDPAMVTPSRVEHLFRGARQAGRMHPLQHLLQSHRQAVPVHGTLHQAPHQAPGAAFSQQPAPAVPSERIDGDQVRQRVRELPPLPKAALDALAALRDDGATSQHCADLISRDQALVARVLKLANSAFYGVPGRVATAREAVHLLGRRTLCSAITVATLTQQFTGPACAGFCFNSFWRHAIGVALASRALARQLRLADETAFTAGLLHDVGRLALATHFPRQMAVVTWVQLDQGRASLSAETEMLGTDHVEVGTLVARQWNFPDEVCAAIAGHHQPPGRPADSASLADIVHVADAMAHALDLAGEPDEQVPDVDPAAWQRVALAKPAALTIFNDTESGVAELCQAMGLP